MLHERLLQDALAGARLTDDDAEAALLAVNTERLEYLGLVGEQCDRLEREWVSVESEVGADHGATLASPVFDDSPALGLRSLAGRSTGLARPIRSPL